MVLPEVFWRRHDLSDLPLNVDSEGERVHGRTGYTSDELCFDNFIILFSRHQK